MKIIGTLSIVIFLVSANVLAISLDELKGSDYGVWSISPDGDVSRWVVIHNLEDAAKSNVFHIEVLGRKIGDKPWHIIRIKKHLAISSEALLVDLEAKEDKGNVHPDQYIGEYRLWLKSEDKPVCKTSLLECIE